MTAARRDGDLRRRPLVAGDHQAALAGPADRRGVGEVDRRLRLVGEPDDGGQQAALGEGAHRVGAGVERRPPPPFVRRLGGRTSHAHRDRRDDAEGALGAQQQLAQVGAGGVGRRRAERERPGRGGGGERDDHRVEAAVAGAGLPARPGGREAADRRVLEGLGVVAEGQPVPGQQRLGLGTAQARLEGRGHRDLVDGEEPLHPHQVEADQAGEAVAAGGEATRHARAAAEGDDRDPVLGGPREQGHDLVVPVGSHDRVGGVGEVTGARPQQVGRRLAARAQGARGVVDEDVVGPHDRAQPVEQRVVERDRRGRRAGDGRAVLEAEGEVDQAERGVGQDRRGVGGAPALRVHLDGGQVPGHALQCDTCRHFVTQASC